MIHADFDTLEIEVILNKVLVFAHAQTGAKRVHWLSAAGLRRVDTTTLETAAVEFITADLVGPHLQSLPVVEPLETYPDWRRVAELYSGERNGHLPAHGLGSKFVYPVSYRDQFLGALLIETSSFVNPVALVASLQTGLELSAKYIYFGYKHLTARNESYIDELTGLYNQRYLPMALEHEINRAKRDRTSFTLLFLDVDYFKMVNDGRGHLVGSKLLIELGKILKDQVRACDYCFRYGGDEFIVLLSNAGPEDSLKVAERMRRAVEQTTYLIEGHNLNLTVSIGLASYPQHAAFGRGFDSPRRSSYVLRQTQKPQYCVCGQLNRK